MTTHTCVYCGEEVERINTHHWEEHPGKRYDPVWYIDE